MRAVMKVVLPLALVLSLFSGTARASSVLFDNLSLNDNGGNYISKPNYLSQLFTVGQTSTLESLLITTIQVIGFTDNDPQPLGGPTEFDWFITTSPINTSMNPINPSGFGLVASGLSTPVNSVQVPLTHYRWNSTMQFGPGVVLGPGSYWMTLQTPFDLNSFSPTAWMIADGPGTGSFACSLNGVVPGCYNTSEQYDYGMRLTGTTNASNDPAVPEPASMLLVGTGLTVVARLRKKRQQAAD